MTNTPEEHPIGMAAKTIEAHGTIRNTVVRSKGATQWHRKATFEQDVSGELRQG
jgi:hypothetical protein